MIVKSPFIYNDDAGSGGGQPAPIVTDTAATTTTDTPQPTPIVIPEDIQKELDELRAYKKSIVEKEPEKTPEQVAKEAQLEQAEMRKFAVENDLMKNEDFTRYETVKQKADKDLVYENWLKEWLEDNKDVDPKEADVRAKEDFETEYNLNSESETIIKRAQKKLAKEAADLRTPVETQYTNVTSKFKTEQEIRKNVPLFNNFIHSNATSNVPDKVTFFEKDVDGEKIAIEVQLTPDENKEIVDKVTKEFIGDVSSYNLFTKETKDGKNEKLQNRIAKEVKSLINEKKQAEAFEKYTKDLIAIGTKKGSNIGANQPYAVVREMGKPLTTGTKSAEELVRESDIEVRRKVHKTA